ncbi:Imm7 family immunity protein [Niabella sp. W65]|nr:Imm7 family immunity protein [Niabella sp. W65]MCH7367429.1 Imm7 family immunity protein [Niabella sp. W65]ULT43613.1 Imm7 family immunity protein [Niabella sp. I65]
MGKEIDEVLEMWEFIAKTAIGSYGVLYLRNDETDIYNFTIYRIAKGKVEQLIDSMLSPTNSIIEEYQVLSRLKKIIKMQLIAPDYLHPILMPLLVKTPTKFCIDYLT